MNYKNLITKFRNKFPRKFRGISFDFLNILNFFSFFVFFPSKIFIEKIIKIKLLKSRAISKVIIRNDKLGDNVLTLPFIYGTSENNQKLFYVSEILKEIIGELRTKCIWEPSCFLNKNDDLIIANLATSNISNFIDYLPKNNNKIIFTQLSTNPFSRNGFPINFSPNYNKNKSQTLFVSNCFDRLKIDSDPVKGIKLLNSQLSNFIRNEKSNLLVIVIGLGIDIGRQLSNNNINDIIKFAKEKSLKPVILEEPGYVTRLKKLALEKDIESRSCKNFLELFTLFKISKYAVGYDCGPMHIASLLTNSIILFSHTPSLHWGRHIWHKFIFQRTLTNKSRSIIISKQLNLGSLKNNWVICNDKKGCALHKKACNDNSCSELNKDLLKKSIKFILKN